jgi:mannose-6-phosphate isomerase class I
MSQTRLYPLQFEPIYQYRLWGGRRLANLLTAPLPGDGPIGKAWVVGDREDHPGRCQWIAQRSDHRSSAGAISRADKANFAGRFADPPEAKV